MSRHGRWGSWGLMLILLSGCAAPGEDRDPVGDVFPSGPPGEPLMSPVDNPLLAARGLRTPPPALIRRALLAQHERWLGTPYRLGGTTRRGIDCSALVQRVFAETFHLALPRTTREQVHEGEAVARETLRPGDLVFFRPPGFYHHVGIYVGEGRFLHASTSHGVKLSSLDNPYWRRHYWRSRRPLEAVRLVRRLDPALLDRGEG